MSKVRTAMIVGGGVAGPVAAAALLRAGIEPTVYEAYSGPAEGIGGGLGLNPNGVRALAIIGADEAVRAVSVPMPHLVMSIGSRSRGEMPTLRDVEPLRAVERSDLHRVLHDTAVAAGVRFEYNKRLVAAEEHPHGITAEFADGSTATADVLIGADGVRSTVRRLIDPDAPGPNYTGLLGFGSYVDLDLGIEPGTMVFAFGKHAYYLYWTLPDGRVAWGANLPSKKYLTLSTARGVPAEDWLRTLRKTYADDTPGAELARRTTGQTLVVTGGIHIMPPVPHWHRGRMALVGDAVHAPSNSTGQGASLAIESAIELARCLRDLPDAATAFAAYEGLRRERVQKIAARGAKINHAKSPGPLAQKMMGVLLPIMFRTMNVEKSLGAEQRYTIDWETPVSPRTPATA